MFDSATPWIAACQASLSFTIFWSLLKFMSIESMMLSNQLILCHSFPSTLSISQHQGHFQWINSSHQLAKVLAKASVLPMNIQDWYPLGLTSLISLLSRGLSTVFSSTTVWKNKFFGAQPSWESNSLISIWLLEKTFWVYGPLSAKWCLGFWIC